MSYNDFFGAVAASVGKPKSVCEPINLHEPEFSDTNAEEYTKDCIRSGWVSTAGEWVDKFELSLEQFTKAKRVVAVSSGTAAIRLCLEAFGVQRGDEVLLPSLTFVGTANAVSHLGAIPHFIDVEDETNGLDPLVLERHLEKVGRREGDVIVNRETGRVIRCIIVVHIFGNSARVREICQIGDKWGLTVLEDAAEALGSQNGVDHCGLIGKAGVLSFNGNKILTTGGGGAVISNDIELCNKIRHLSTTAKLQHKWHYYHDQVGWNERLPNINAALGFAQMEVIKKRLEAKSILFQRYERNLAAAEDFEIIRSAPNTSSNNWLISCRIKESAKGKVELERLLEMSYELGYRMRPVWQPLHTLAMYRSCPRSNLAVTLDLASRIVCMPSSHFLV